MGGGGGTAVGGGESAGFESAPGDDAFSFAASAAAAATGDDADDAESAFSRHSPFASSAARVMMFCLLSVSYTHLTLPTICSV